MEKDVCEFFKLDSIDKKVLFWMMDNDKDAIASWTKEITEQYAKRRSVYINPKRLLSEIELELEPTENTA